MLTHAITSTAIVTPAMAASTGSASRLGASVPRLPDMIPSRGFDVPGLVEEDGRAAQLSRALSSKRRSTSAIACSRRTPGFRRAMICIHHIDTGRVVPLSTRDAIAIGIVTSVVSVIRIPSKPSGVTPTIVTGTRLT